MDEENHDDKCPVCLQERYLNKEMVLMVSPCYHKMCQACISRIFNAGPAPCPICKTTLRKSNFTIQTFDDLFVEREVVSKLFNKRQDDFPTLRAFNDYLEESEDLIFNLLENKDVQETERKIAQYYSDNRDLITRNQQKEEMEDRLVAAQILREKKEKQLRREAYEKLEQEGEKLLKQEQEDIINQLASATDQTKILNMISSSKQRLQMQNEKLKKKALEPIFVKVEMEEDEVDNFMALGEDEFDPVDEELNFYKGEGLFLRKGFGYSTTWTPEIKDQDVLKAMGYEKRFTFERSIHESMMELF